MLEAIDQTFLIRLFFGMTAYWLVGIFVKGIFEPLQAHIGGKIWAKLTNKSEDLRRYADQTCTELDDFFINHLADSIGGINRIINRDDIPQSDRQLYRQLLTERYQLALLLEKLGLDNIPKV
jgi:hypothetical protein